METRIISKIQRQYHKYGIWLNASLTLLVIMGMSVGWLSLDLSSALVVCVAYMLLTNILHGIAWKHMAARSHSVLAKFYMASSALRFICSAAVIVIFCLVVGDREAILGFVALFFVFYAVMLVFDSVFFYRIEKCNNVKVKE